MSGTTKEDLQKQIDKMLLEVEKYVNKIADNAQQAVILIQKGTVQSEIASMDLLKSSDKYYKEITKINDKIKK